MKFENIRNLREDSDKLQVELADYLNIDRSAMSFEMSKLKNEGIIEFEKN